MDDDDNDFNLISENKEEKKIPKTQIPTLIIIINKVKHLQM